MMLSLIGPYNSNLNSFELETLRTEKKNFINIFKLVVKDLIDISLKNNKHVDKQSAQLYHFYDVFENILNHGFKGKKGFGLGLLNRNKDLTVLLDLITAKCDSNNSLASIKDLTEIKTSLGRIRAWIRLCLMQKKLAENFMNLIFEKDILIEFFDKESILVSDEANIIAGLLIGLNALDISIDIKSESNFLDLPLKQINYSVYLREKLPDFDDSVDLVENSSEQRINEIFDQKNFLEEINKKLEAKNDQLQLKLQSLEMTNTSLAEKISAFQVENLSLKSDLETSKSEKTKLENEYKIKIESVYQDVQAERDTFNFSKNGLDQMYIEIQKKYNEENKLRLSIESELQLQNTIKNEQESAIKLLETSLKDKHDLINLLRTQLEQVKSINLDLVSEAHVNEMEYKRQAQETTELKDQIYKLNTENEEIKKKFEACENNLKKKEEICKLRLEQIDIYQKKLTETEKDISIEKNWRLQLQNDLNEKNEKLNEEIKKVEALKKVEQEHKIIKDEFEKSKLKISELELTLEEMGSRLGTSQLKMQDFKEVTKQLHEFQWENDEKVTSCKICTKDFNVARRKHHCRRCGGIFCNECSDNKMALPSSSKPVRVCNICFEQMLQKSTLK